MSLHWDRYTLFLNDPDLKWDMTLVTPLMFGVWRGMASRGDLRILIDTPERFVMVREENELVVCTPRKEAR